ncbi:Bpu10I family restriction endonuclease [Lachnospiraceae bacterium CLA-AA-H246]|jgi:predicted RNA-binding protein Jag|uniref:Bpu10I family restriction endonuclease n=1 Tax=Hominisplanchenecus faecis TaxID=2885351 RepID=A0ABS8EVQ7_9FIRM|nr:Bpu10I family restriction endonuclease [Hominisplanchenecus faecis]MCC2149276.1 Bpu10I family restriction endonuclease [Hominisplanchenecus faecis]SCJ95199.1 Bpu10I restriction endonuclease [uncultured Ruminococcus sp.]
MARGVHGEKIVSAIQSNKMPVKDVPRLEMALQRYDEWIEKLKGINAETVDELVEKLVTELNTYKNYIDINLIFDSEEDFLYRQKGQLKLDNTVIEEFMPIFVKKCVEKVEENCDIEISSQIPTFSSVYFASSLSNPNIGGGINIKTKDQDFSMSRKLYLQSSYDPQFNPEKTVKLETHLGYVLAEMKTNLDKTMFQEASATAHDIKQAVTGAKYYLLCDYLDMTPISTTTTDIDEILILRKAKRISSNIRKEFSTKIGREKWRPWYTEYLMNNPYSVDMFKRFINHIFSQMSNEELIEESVLEVGYF